MICVDCEKPIEDCEVSVGYGKQKIPRCFKCFLKYAEKKKREVRNKMDKIDIKIIIRTCRDRYRLNVLKNILWGHSRYKKEEYVIGMLSNHSSLDSYVLISKKEHAQIMKKKQVDYPKLNIFYYDQKWFERRLKKLRSVK